MDEKKSLIQKIKDLKKSKNAIVLAHCYQNIEIDEVADFVGDSLYLSREAAKTNADVIIFAGVYFMAETAKILSPQKKVYIPQKDAGCMMADMINTEKLLEFKSKYPDVPVVCYVNSTAAVKALSDICCTSANALDVVRSLNSDKVLFVPDKNLGKYVSSKISDKEIVCYDGYCPVHNLLTVNDIKVQKERYPSALVLTHPECREDVVHISDYVGSTTGIMKYVSNSNEKEFIIVTEIGVVQRLRRDYPDKKFIHVSPKAVCDDMKKISLNDIYNSLLNETYEIKVSDNLIKSALRPIEKMINI